ncbi:MULTISPECIES: hypothetical protein [Marinobacter]|uniref:hypothetical protein n=1 Tax=Marinobacter TaxID=2742 RepID=UPI0013A6FBB0|nr:MULTISPECIES: hypothetical protein [Marinobacter]
MRNDLLGLYVHWARPHTMTVANACDRLTEAGYIGCMPEANHRILCRSGQRIHLYGDAELLSFAQHPNVRRPLSEPHARSFTMEQELQT